MLRVVVSGRVLVLQYLHLVHASCFGSHSRQLCMCCPYFFLIHQRLANLQSLRKMIAPPVDVQVLRSKKWETIKSTELVPGDVVFLKREKKDCVLPCDFLLLSGTAIANEAMLTGESTPQLKVSSTPLFIS